MFWDHDWEQVTTRPFSSAEQMLACTIHLIRGGKVAGLAAIDRQGSAATEYAFFDE